jgi:hypothetical protein
MSIYGHHEVDIEKTLGHWSVRTSPGLKEILRISFHWAFEADLAYRQGEDFHEALFTCAFHFPLTSAEKDDVFSRFPHLRDRRAIGEEDLSTGPARVAPSRRIVKEDSPKAPERVSPSRTGVKNRKIG